MSNNEANMKKKKTLPTSQIGSEKNSFKPSVDKQTGICCQRSCTKTPNFIVWL